MKKTASQVLQEARARLAKRWIQGDLRDVGPDGTPGYCAIGALWHQEVADLTHPRLDLTPDAAMAVARVYNQARAALHQASGWISLAAYNDDPDRTQADILALYDRALTLVTK